MRWRTITADGELGMRRFWTMGVIRAQAIEILQAVSFDVDLELELWVSRVGRTSLTYGQTISRLEDGARVVNSTATIVALDSDRQPKEISPEAKSLVLDRPMPTIEAARGPVVVGAWSREIQIRPSDQDLQQHVNHARYADYVEDARLLCARDGGYGAGDWDGPVSTFSISYEKESRVGDRLQARTWRVPDTNRVLEFELGRGAPGEDVVVRARVELR